MGLFGASARLRDKSLASPEQYQPMFSPTVPESRPMDENITFPSDLGAAMNIPQIKQGGGAFGRGGVGWSILGAIGDGLSQMGGYGAPFAHQQALLRKQQMDEQQYQRERSDKRDDFIWQQQHQKPQLFPSGRGGVVMVDPNTMQATTVREPDPEPTPSAQRLIEWAASLPDGDPRKEMAKRALPGASYDLGIQQPLIDARAAAQAANAAARADLALRNKQAPSYAQSHGGGKARPSAKLPSGFILDQ